MNKNVGKSAVLVYLKKNVDVYPKLSLIWIETKYFEKIIRLYGKISP